MITKMDTDIPMAIEILLKGPKEGAEGQGIMPTMDARSMQILIDICEDLPEHQKVH